MSADNGIYILKTGAGSANEEFRVIEASAIENLWWNEETNQEQETPYWSLVYEYYKNASVFSTRGEVLELAHDMADELPICEYGVSTIIETEHAFEDLPQLK